MSLEYSCKGTNNKLKLILIFFLMGATLQVVVISSFNAWNGLKCIASTKSIAEIFSLHLPFAPFFFLALPCPDMFFGSMLCSFWTCYGFEDMFWVHVMLVLDLLWIWGHVLGPRYARFRLVTDLRGHGACYLACYVRLWVHNMVGYERNMYVPGYHETCLGIIIIRWKNDRAKRKRADWGKKNNHCSTYVTGYI